MGYFYAIAAAVTWGFVYAIDQKILDKVSSPMLVFINAVFSMAVLLPFLIFKSKGLREITTLDKSTVNFIALSLVFTLAANLLIYIAIQHFGSSKAAIFEIAYPFFVVIFSILMFNAQVNGYFILGSLLMFIGSAIIITLG
ncbi:MAG: DMT family transporter [Parcubacteria group bacterium]|jgi:drug/metabolite transporter (DMT)-like permease